MDLEYGPEYDDFRAEVRAFLAEAWPEASRSPEREHAPDPGAQRAFVRGTLTDGDQIIDDGVHRVAPGTRVRRAEA